MFAGGPSAPAASRYNRGLIDRLQAPSTLAGADQRPTVIPWSDLESAFCNTMPGFRRYLDRVMGSVVTIQVAVVANIMTLQWIAAEPGRFLRIQPIASREQHGWITRFVTTVEEPSLRARLVEAIEGVGAFQRFKQILRSEPRERQRWQELRAGLLREHIAGWLQVHGVSVSEGPTMLAGALGPSSDMLDEAELRALALAQLEGLSAHSLPSAVGFLRYLENKTR